MYISRLLLEEQKMRKGENMNNKNEILSMKNKLEAILGQGIELYLDGKP